MRTWQLPRSPPHRTAPRHCATPSAHLARRAAPPHEVRGSCRKGGDGLRRRGQGEVHGGSAGRVPLSRCKPATPDAHTQPWCQRSSVRSPLQHFRVAGHPLAAVVISAPWCASPANLQGTGSSLILSLSGPPSECLAAVLFQAGRQRRSQPCPECIGVRRAAPRKRSPLPRWRRLGGGRPGPG